MVKSSTFDASSSRDSDGGTALGYEWREGSVLLSNAMSFTEDNLSVGTHTITLTVTDDDANATASVSVTITSAGSSSTQVKKTGQTKSYNASGDEVTDDSIKDDGYYYQVTGVTPSYSRVGDVVTDHITGLEWQDDAEAGTVTKQWVTDANYDAGNYSDTSGDTATTYCSTLTLDGGGWRLPTVVELQSIVVDGAYNPSIDTTAFENYKYLVLLLEFYYAC